MRKKRKNFRRIVVNGQCWQWMCGRSVVVAYNDETGEKRNISRSEISGWSEYDIERSLWKGGGWYVGPYLVGCWLAGKPLPTPAPMNNIIFKAA